MPSSKARSCVLVVENLPVPFDRRVWQEACALRDAGWLVSVICPKSERYPASHEVIDGIYVYRHPLPFEARGKWAFVAEYASALFHEARLLGTVLGSHGFSVIQICNPPDLLFLPAMPFKLMGKRLVFDHHDVCPELFSVKFGRKGLLHQVLLWCEWLTFRAADFVISTNETFRQIAIGRGGVSPDRVVTVYSVPDRSRMHRVPVPPDRRPAARFVIGYVGIIGSQDGVDHLVRAVAGLVKAGSSDVHALIVGDGPELPSLKALAADLGVQDKVTFTGYLTGQDLLEALSAFDMGVIPDAMNEYNDKISMNKVFEYAALGLPIVATPLTETRRLLGDAALFAKGGDPESLAEAIAELLANDALREELGRKAEALGRDAFQWSAESAKYVAVFERLVAEREPSLKRQAPEPS